MSLKSDLEILKKRIKDLETVAHEPIFTTEMVDEINRRLSNLEELNKSRTYLSLEKGE